MIVMQPVLEALPPADFALWPVAAVPSPGFSSTGFLPLGGAMSRPEIGTAVMLIAAGNDLDPGVHGDDRPPRPADPLGSFLHGLLTFDTPYAAGGLRVTDTSTGVVLVPGCCSGVEEWREWFEVLDGGGSAGFGHDPDPLAERLGDTVRLTVDAERHDSPVIELPAAELRRLLAGAERDLAAFLDAAAAWAARHIPDHAGPVTQALTRVLALDSAPPPGVA
ncbi:hypothetical protein ACGFMM_35340 [Streptomyces sp. NPDC048604]|uniref:hypothetical protein n=1 Tax=Streptomyces sp. NPDC048604 TaxID=3365578 RepID=UPI0037148F25